MDRIIVNFCNFCKKKARKNGKTAAGNQRYRCDRCKINWTDSLNVHGSFPINEKPKDPRSRMKLYRYRKRIFAELAKKN